MRALRDMNLPKFVYDDVPLFLGLISDLFPGLNCPRVRYPNFNDAVEETLEKNKYILLPQQVSELTFSPPIPLRLYTLPYWSNPPFLIFDIWALWLAFHVESYLYSNKADYGLINVCY